MQWITTREWNQNISEEETHFVTSHAYLCIDLLLLLLTFLWLRIHLDKSMQLCQNARRVLRCRAWNRAVAAALLTFLFFLPYHMSHLQTKNRAHTAATLKSPSPGLTPDIPPIAPPNTESCCRCSHTQLCFCVQYPRSHLQTKNCAHTAATLKSSSPGGTPDRTSKHRIMLSLQLHSNYPPR